MKPIEYIRHHWQVVTIAVTLMGAGWYANAEMTEMAEAKEIAVENTKSLQATKEVVDGLVRTHELMAYQQRIRDLEAQLLVRGAVFETVAGEEEGGEAIVDDG